jgi:hypothetical protein
MNGIVVFCLALSLCACKTWYKQGGDSDELELEQSKCEALTGTDTGEAFDACMAEAGWHNTTISATSVEPSDGDNDDDTAPGADRQVPANNEGTPAAATADGAATSQTDGKEESRTSAGWFQLGTDEGDLESDQTDCANKATGAAAFERCMRNKGWRPLGVRISPDY